MLFGKCKLQIHISELYLFYICEFNLINMEERLVQLLKSEGINPTRFAERIGVQRSSISHIMSGRNKPSYDFIIRILDSFPNLSPDWLLRGKGLMYKSDIPVQPGLFDSIQSKTKVPPKIVSEENGSISIDSVTQPDSMEKHLSHQVPEQVLKEGVMEKARKIDKVVIFYSDKTFTDYLPDVDI
jgi:transcriptional regulator with XRE-family HTH domain